MSQKDNNLPFPNYLMDEAQSTFATPELTRVLNLARHEPRERPEVDMKDMIEQRFSEGRGILPINTGDSDALLAQKVRRALEMANGQRVAIIQWDAPEEQSAAEIQRFGFDTGHPETGRTNRQDLEKELGDVRNAERMMIEAGDVSPSEIQLRAKTKSMTIGQYLHHQPEQEEGND